MGASTVFQTIVSKLSPWQVARVARHESRPYTMDYLEIICPDFQELHGDRMYADDPAIIGGVGRIEGQSFMIIGHQKGRDTKERVRRNYGMPKPEGYRKAQRLMRMAEKFSIPVVTFIDTPGAYPGVGAEEDLEVVDVVAFGSKRQPSAFQPFCDFLVCKTFHLRDRNELEPLVAQQV